MTSVWPRPQLTHGDYPLPTGCMLVAVRGMSRWGRLTAIFALVVGIVLANPGAAQPQPRAHVYLLRGLMNIFSLGMDTLAEQLKRRGVYATVHNYEEWQALADRAAADYKAGKEAPIILIGQALTPSWKWRPI